MPELTIEAGPNVEVIDSHSAAMFFCRHLLARRQEATIARVLVAGCGEGHEAYALHRMLSAEVDAVDVKDFVSDDLRELDGLRFQLASVSELPFADATFDAVFYHHVIEHVDDPTDSLRELRRVLTDDGILFVGTPNRNRLVSSVGAHKQSEWEATLKNKLLDNVNDWWDRCRGRFRNELGAHAGFTRRELDAMLSPLFSQRSWVTEDYLKFKYGDHRLHRLVDLATKRPWNEVLVPSIYVLCEI